MPRIDDYNQALALVKGQLAEKNPDHVARVSGAEMIRDKGGPAALSLVFLNQEMRMSWPDLKVLFGKSGEEIPVQQQILLLHYLHGAWSSNGFHRRAKNPLVQAFGERPENMAKLASQAYKAQPFDQGDASVKVRALPRINVALILWKGDDEFPPEGNILFDRNIVQILSAEDIAWLAGMVVYPLIGMAKQKG